MNDTQSNVRQIADRQPQTMATHVISYVLDGFAITSTIETAAPIRQIVDKLKAIGATPTNLSPTGDKSTPTCPTHNSPMKQGRRGWFCPKKTGDEYCKETKNA